MQGDKTTECLKLQGLFQKSVAVKFDQEKTSSDGGALLLKAADKSTRLLKRLSDSLIDRREQGKINHTIEELLLQRVYAIACGYADGNDASRLRNDPVHKLLVNAGKRKSGDLASQPTLSRFENSIDSKDLLRMSNALAECVIEHHGRRLGKKVRRITLDMDITDDPTHGNQQLTFFHGYYMKYCYLPMLAFMTFNDEKDQYLLTAMLRPGNVHDTYGAVPLMERLLKMLRNAFPRAEIRVRLDAGFAAPATFSFLDSQSRLHYAVGMAKNPVLQGFSEKSMKRSRRNSLKSGKSEREYGEFKYAAMTWDKKRRVVFKAEVVRHPGREPRDNERFVITNMQQSPEWVYSSFYTGRGDIENRIKELLIGLQIDRTSCSSFLANQFRILLSAAAYVLIQEIRRRAGGTAFERAQAWTIITRLIKIGVRVVRSVRRIVFHMPAAFPDQRDWIRIASQLMLDTV